MSKEVALIKSEAVVNLIIADDEFISHISNEYEHVIDIAGMYPRPGIGWTYTDGEFKIPGEFENGAIIEIPEDQRKSFEDLETTTEEPIE